jgi:GNAT superfamily N-acetyltransferase
VSTAAEEKASRPTVGQRPVRPATSDDVPRLAHALAAAFFDDPVLGWLMPVEGKRRAGLERFFEVELRTVGLARGTVWTTADLAGAALSAPPGRWRMPWFTALRHGPAFAQAFGVRLPRASVLLQLLERRHVRWPHHYFPYIGVAPEGQGQGLGSRLMKPTLDRCDEARLPAYLEASNERCAALYERLGFVPIDEVRFRGSPPLRLMLRPPGSSS